MTRSSQKLRNAFTALLIVILSQACMQLKTDATPVVPTPQAIVSSVANEGSNLLPTPTETLKPVVPAPPTVTLEPVVPTFQTAAASPFVTINVVKGNLFIRRGPGMAYNPVGVLYKNTSTTAIARDVLSNWVQVKIPDSDQEGWVSIQTGYSQVEGNVKDLPEWTNIEWPQAAYLRNCTYHRMYVMPGEIVIPPSLQFPENEIWIYPGEYVVYDIDVTGDPDVADIVIREGSNVEIRDDGLGGHRKCP
jgi:hypothetical protein